MPTNFDPTAYAYVGAFDSGDDTPGRFMGQPSEYTMDDGTVVTANNYVHAEYVWLAGHLRRSGTSTWSERGACDHCGARIRYVAVLRHASGDHIAVGETCLDNRVSLASKADFDRLRKASNEARAEQRIKTLRTEVLDANPGLESVLWPVPEWMQGTWAGGVAQDMNAKLRRYGDLSPKQIAFALTLPQRARDEQTKTERREAEKAAALPVPVADGRQTVEGTVVSRKVHESDYGTSWKLTVKHADGWCVWVTEPSSIITEVGDVIRFDAKLEVSDRDPKFAFGKRPTKASIITPVTPEPVCSCRGPVAEDPCGHGDTSEGCPVHDPNYDPEA